MSPLSGGKTGPAYWRSLEELADTPEFRRFVEDEFPGLAAELTSSPTRRQFLKIMGASLALAGLTGCRWPKETILPYSDRPKNRTPGVPEQYATAMELAGVATGLLVTSYDGRPIKIEGNPKHPFSRGKSSAIQQASVLELYDPDRSQNVLDRASAAGGAPVVRKWEDFVAFAGPHFAALREKGGAGFCVLSEASSSPSLLDMKLRLLKAFPQAKWYEYEPLSRDNEREGARLAFGKPYRTHLHLDKADVIVSLDSDFLMTHPAAVKYAGDFAARRRAEDGTMNRLYVFESVVSVTGTMADHRFAVRSSQVGAVAVALQAELAKLLPEKAELAGAAAIASLPVPVKEIAALAKDLMEHKGRGVVVAGPRQPAEVHAIAHVLNAALGNVGNGVTYAEELEPERPTHLADIAELYRRINAGEVDTLLILGGNPVYNAPSDLYLGGDMLGKVKTGIHLSLYDDETSAQCRWHLPRAQYLETWADARAFDGTLSIVQPLIDPLYDGKTPCEVLALISGDDLTKGYDITRRTFREQFARGGDAEAAWKAALHEGVVPNTAWTPQMPAVRALPPWQPKPAEADAYELVFVEDHKVYDGRFANNGWLQEMPDPITKLTWDNAALISPADAKKLGVEKYGDTILISHWKPQITLPAYILPGHAEGSITLPLGYQCSAGGQVAANAGYRTHLLRTSATMSWAVRAARVARVPGGSVNLATTQDHHSIRSNVGDEATQERIPELIREIKLAEYKKEPNVAQQGHRPLQLWQAWNYESGHKWGMAIDLTACTGCSACVVACQAENNIPVVGKDEVARGREMHWIRVDRYFKEAGEGHADDGAKGGAVEVVHQPMTCHHCENAPCEQVCPVSATVHDEEGLNVQVYNRCVGTRYCNNNCPFKVRRFNWFWNHHGPKHPRHGEALTNVEKMVYNPEVTMRSRGVMEKCSFCVQRINAVKILAKNEGWTSIPDGAITPACAQACPTDAIVFGDLNDPNSRVRKLHGHDRAYGLLDELNLRVRTRYLARLRNPAEETKNG